MSYPSIKAKFAHEIGTRVSLRVYWGDSCNGTRSYHNAQKHLFDKMHSLMLGDKEHFGGEPEDYTPDQWPTVCESCGMIVPPDATKQVFNTRLYDTPSGKPEPGNLYYAHWLPPKMYWDNKEDFHLVAVCPDGDEWNIDSRASNCTMKDDRTHRCWVRHGDPETGQVHVDKNGYTCSAGAGSIQTHRGYHGFLHNGIFSVG